MGRAGSKERERAGERERKQEAEGEEQIAQYLSR